MKYKDMPFCRQDHYDNASDTAADEMIYIGGERKDIECAHRFGCKGVLIDRRNRNAEFGQDFTVTDLNGMKKISYKEKNYGIIQK